MAMPAVSTSAGREPHPPGPAAGREPHHLDAPPARRPGLCRFAVVTAVLTLVLIQVGAMVTSTGSGLAYPDWPMANGSWWPPEMREWCAGFLEHGHRTIGAFIGLLFLVLAVWTMAAERRAWVRWYSVGLLALVCLQGVIGGKGVQWGLPVWTSALHGILAQTLLCLLTVFAFVTSRAFALRVALPAATVRTARALAATAVAAIFVQLVLGAIVRHADVRGVLWLHVTVAMVVTLLILGAALFSGVRLREVPGLRGTTRWLLVVLVLQLVLGFATLAVRGGGKATASVEQVGRALIVTGHVVVGAAMFLLATLLCARLFRNVVPAPAAR
ncbi:MAG TPA: COX15/CtaA family protein [Planctomycetota bacterium]|nr:COX15/CtaA family protein [Planctomycetota bacterium]